jgi:DNA-binding response OmpR family regulator
MSPTVLIVDADDKALETPVTVLREAGYLVTVASTFADARLELRRHPPDLLITDLRLDIYNGLHLIITASQQERSIATIVTHAFFDPVLEREAKALGALYLQKPIGRAALLEAARVALAGVLPHPPTSFRRWPRRRPSTALEIRVGERPARVRNVSYGGLSFETSRGRAETPCELPPSVDVEVPSITSPLRVAVAWGFPSAGGCMFGAALEEANVTATTAWRDFVDRIA